MGTISIPHDKIVTAEQKADAVRRSAEMAVNAERTRRIVAGTTIGSIRVTGRDEDARNLSNLALAAQMMLAAGDATTVTVYRDGDNVDHELTPAQLLSLWQGSAAFVSALYQASWAIKAMEDIPADLSDDALWAGA